MAGFNNEVLYSIAQRLQPSTPQSILLAQQNTDDVSTINYTGDPNSVVSANPGSLSHDPVAGDIWQKVDGVQTTIHWKKLLNSGTGVQTLTGNTGGAIGPDSTGTINVVTANTTTKFAGAVHTETLDFGLTNLLLGSPGSSITSAQFNVGTGLQALQALTSGGSNVCVGFQSGFQITSGGGNTAVGHLTLGVAGNCSGNTAIGSQAGDNLLGNNNTIVGSVALVNGGSTQNIVVGYASANTYNGSESSNIIIGSPGVVGESNKIRIGVSGSGTGQQNSAFMAGITASTVANSAPVGVDPAGQLSSLGYGTADQVLTSNGAGNSPTWQAVSASGSVVTLTGNSGGAINPDGAGNINLLLAHTNILNNGSGNTITADFLDNAFGNLIMGSSVAQTLNPLNAQNLTSYGSAALNAVVSSKFCAAFGGGALERLTSGRFNTMCGASSGSNLLTTDSNTGCGYGTLNTSVTGAGNTALGALALTFALGSNNIAIGNNSGINYTGTEGSNILVGHNGVLGESNVIRVGVNGSGAGQQNACFVAGITAATVVSSAPVGVDPTGQLSSLGYGTANQVLTSTGAGNSPVWGPVSASGAVISLSGNTGGAIPPSGTGTINLDTANATVQFVGAGNTITQDFNINNLILGSSAPSLTSGSFNVGLGQSALNAITSGGACTCVGYDAGLGITSGNNNTYIGATCGLASTTGQSNTAVGASCFDMYTSGAGNAGSNTAIGVGSLNKLLTGTFNTCLGAASGQNYTSSESSNICIGHTGVAAESHALRIGTAGSGSGNVNTCFIAGINGVTVTGTAVLCSTAGQLGTIASSIRYKENVADLPEEVSVLHLRPRQFNYKKDDSKTTQYGLVAEEVEQDFKYLCFYNDAGEPESVKYHELPVLLLKEIQRLNERIKKLEKQCR